MSPPAGFGYPNYPPGMPPPRGFNGPGVPPNQQAQQQPQLQLQPQTQPRPPQSQQSIPPPPLPVKETIPDVGAAAAAPPPPPPSVVNPTSVPPGLIAPASKPAGVVPAMPIPISIPVQTRSIKPLASQPQEATKPSPTTSPHPDIADTAKVTTAAEVQSLSRSISDIKISSTSTPPLTIATTAAAAATATITPGTIANNAPGAGGYLTQPRRRQYSGSAAVRKMDQDYDFESANAKFNKEDIAKEVAAQVGVTTDGSPFTETGPSAAQLRATLAEDSFYDRKKSFFDNISCENKDRNAQDATPNPNSWKRGERRLNFETFGQASVDYGSGRYGRGGGGGGGYRGGRGGWRGRGSGRGRGWRGGARANGQNASGTTATATSS